ncbi:uncharacterized protein J7T54_005581 [Emericellopsis cladophorae]|uniref:Cyclin-D1-binding protein 1-like N-terminal domain-containing protein n=1 Tax=Emericellopsis cladophorae TaxID=2686198 RepID=A0A9P9Y4W0_9HYPO|nr:uncharacterized protein J7T54_005581 [Emericellopsis cladophorae]KAI6783552.1 hypothetical protein J7T54_005581 [Emericellopsis cladophorae]
MAPESLQSLDAILNTSLTLLAQLQTALTKIHATPNQPSSNTPTLTKEGQPIDAIALARDSASLIRAHTTKLSLLVVNEPFSAKAVVGIVRDLVGGPVPGLASALEECTPDRYTSVFRKELAWCCRTVFIELSGLLSKVPRDGKALSGSKEGFGPDRKGSIAFTGVLWAACDEVTKLANLGIGGFLKIKVEEWRDTLQDVMEELKEWGDEEAEDEEEGDEEDEVDQLAEGLQNAHLSAQDMVDDMMDSASAIPKADPDKIRPRLETSLKRLRLVTILYNAIVKRRIKKLPQLPPPATADEDAQNVTKRLDEAAAVLRVLPDRCGDLACAFYELEPDEIDSIMDQCFLDAFAVSELLGRSWDGGKDEFTEWTDKFQEEMKGR